jgi:hypothetical protein
MFNEKILQQKNKKGIVEVIDRLMKLFNLYVSFSFSFLVDNNWVIVYNIILYFVWIRIDRIKMKLVREAWKKVCCLFHRVDGEGLRFKKRLLTSLSVFYFHTELKKMVYSFYHFLKIKEKFLV